MIALTLVGTRKAIEEAVAVAAELGAESGNIENLDREESALKNPIITTITQIGEVATTVALTFGAGTSALVFVDKLLDIYKKLRNVGKVATPIEVSDANTNERIGKIDDDGITEVRERLRKLNK